MYVLGFSKLIYTLLYNQRTKVLDEFNLVGIFLE